MGAGVTPTHGTATQIKQKREVLLAYLDYGEMGVIMSRGLLPNTFPPTGQWKNNEMHGPGVYIGPDGTRMAVNYEFGKCVKSGPQQ